MHVCEESREAAAAHDGIVAFGFRRKGKKLVLESIQTLRKEEGVKIERQKKEVSNG